MTKRDIPNLSPIIFHQRRVTPLSIKISSYIFQKIVNNHNIIEKKLDLGKRFSLRMEPLSYFFLVARGRFMARGRFVCHLRRWLGGGTGGTGTLCLPSSKVAGVLANLFGAGIFYLRRWDIPDVLS